MCSVKLVVYYAIPTASQDNILLSHDLTPVVADFGLSRMIPDFLMTRTTTGVKGTPRWTAPELFDLGEGPTKESDVWALGMTLSVSSINYLASLD